MKTINGKPFKYSKETKSVDKQLGDSATVISSVTAEVASESNMEPAACMASFSTIVQN